MSIGGRAEALEAELKKMKEDYAKLGVKHANVLKELETTQFIRDRMKKYVEEIAEARKWEAVAIAERNRREEAKDAEISTLTRQQTVFEDLLVAAEEVLSEIDGPTGFKIALTQETENKVRASIKAVKEFR